MPEEKVRSSTTWPCYLGKSPNGFLDYWIIFKMEWSTCPGIVCGYVCCADNSVVATFDDYDVSYVLAEPVEAQWFR